MTAVAAFFPKTPAWDTLTDWLRPKTVTTVITESVPEPAVEIPESAETEVLQALSAEIEFIDDNGKTTRETVTVSCEGLTEHSVLLQVTPVLQKPQLPTGCEITALTTVLNYYGYDVTKLTLLDFLTCSDSWTSPHEAFIGNPRLTTGCGCFSEPIVAAAKGYLATRENPNLTVENLSGKDFEVLLRQVAAGYPVLFWATEKMAAAYWNKSWEYNGETYRLLQPEHCMVLIGYNLDTGTVTVCDPLQGTAEYALCTAKARYTSMESQAVLIKPAE